MTWCLLKDVSMNYTPISSCVGDFAKANDGNFEIIGEGTIVQCYWVDGKEREITCTHTLHTPTLNSNLVSVSMLDKAGLTTTFGQGQGIAWRNDGTIVLAGKGANGMYLLESVDVPQRIPLAMSSLSQSTPLKQWHRRLMHCSPLIIKDMAAKNLVDGLKISNEEVNGKCEDCILRHQTQCPFDGETDKTLPPLDLISFDLWGPCIQSIGGKIYLMIIVDGGSSYKFGAYLSDKLDTTTLATFDAFHTKSETLTGKKVHRLRMDGAFDMGAWKEYDQKHTIIHKFSAPYSSLQNGLAKCTIWTTIDDVCTLLWDSGLTHSYWAEAAAYSIDTHKLIPSGRHPSCIPLEMFTGKCQSVAHLCTFGAKCWAKVPTIHGVQVTGGSKLNSRSVKYWLLGYTSGNGNYKVQDISNRCVFVSWDVIFEEGHPHWTLMSVGEEIH